MLREFGYHLDGAGWAVARFTGDSHDVYFDVSYLNDSLKDLCDALLELAGKDRFSARVFFVEEPGEYVLVLQKDGDTLLTEIYWSDDWVFLGPGQPPHPDRKIVYSENDSFTNFVSIICQGIEALRQRHTLEEYKQQWVEHEFPEAAFEGLKRIAGF